MKTDSNTLCRVALVAAAALLGSCTTQNAGGPRYVGPAHTPGEMIAEEVPEQVLATVNPLTLTGKTDPGYVNPFPQGTYEHFVAQPAYPKTMENYCNEQLLDQLTVANSKIVVCIPQQRARLYVNGKVAYDWPVSTGTNGHETPTGVFRILDRATEHHSGRYGKIVGANGKTINSNVDMAKMTLPEGAEFKGSSMPHWNRLTWDGVGIHGGKVVAGQRLSHGCIRTPYDVARKLFNYTRKDLPVYVSRAVEDYHRGGAVKPIDVKYRPKPGNDYTDMAPEQYKQTNA